MQQNTSFVDSVRYHGNSKSLGLTLIIKAVIQIQDHTIAQLNINTTKNGFSTWLSMAPTSNSWQPDACTASKLGHWRSNLSDKNEQKLTFISKRNSNFKSLQRIEDHALRVEHQIIYLDANLYRSSDSNQWVQGSLNTVPASTFTNSIFEDKLTQHNVLYSQLSF